MFSSQEINSLRNFLQGSALLNDEGRALFFSILEEGEPFPSEFLEAVSTLIGVEKEYSQSRLKEVRAELVQKKQELAKTETALNKTVDEISEKYPAYLEEKKNAALEKMKKAAAEFDKKEEDLIGEAKDDQVDAIRNFLNKPKA